MSSLRISKNRTFLATIMCALMILSSVSLTPHAFGATVEATGTDSDVCDQSVSNASDVTAERISGGDCLVMFKSGSVTWTAPAGITTVRYLVVGGGGAGGSVYNTGSAGGGGGGQVQDETGSVTPGNSYPVVVGAGSQAPTSIATLATDQFTAIAPGGSSSFLNLESIGGGGGSSIKITSGSGVTNATGGFTGGGGSAHATLEGLRSTGNVGGDGGAGNPDNGSANYQSGGGGGGAGADGNRGTDFGDGGGGGGIASDITGVSVMYGGGGGSGRRTGTYTAANRGTDGGGNGAIGSGNGSAGATNRGGGGGGSGGSGVYLIGGTGGSGVVYIRYTPVAPSAPVLTSIASGDKKLTINYSVPSSYAISSVTYSLNGGGFISAGTTSSPFVISGLAGRTTYSVAIKASNAVGESITSNVVSATTSDAVADQRDRDLQDLANKRAKEQKELTEILSLIPSITSLSQSVSSLSENLLMKKCLRVGKVKKVSIYKPCPKGYKTK
jgi:hypothetical protein